MTQPHPWDAGAPDGVHIWNTLGYRFAEGAEDRVTLEWDAVPAYAFPNGGRTIVHGGMVATLLDTAMGHACLARLGPDESFLTADLHVDFYRAATPGTLRAEGRGQTPVAPRDVLRGVALRRRARAARVGTLHADREERA